MLLHGSVPLRLRSMPRGSGPAGARSVPGGAMEMHPVLRSFFGAE